MRLFSKFLILFWAFNIIVASTCFGADVHYCNGEAKSFGIFETAKPCKMFKSSSKEVPECCKPSTTAKKTSDSGQPALTKRSCCHNKQVCFKSDFENQSGETNSFADHESLGNIEPSDGYELATRNKILSDVSFRPPPDNFYRQNLHILIQVFRI
ncbi:MAG: hypothetical protein ACFHU9_09335 [Fluviicola sp.]